MGSPEKNRQGTWSQALYTFSLPLLLILLLRWVLLEPFVIPSGSMIPNLLIHDHILVKKFSYGLKVPFLNHWLIRWSRPERGDIIVFKFPQNPDVYYIKRLIGLPGDQISVRDGRLQVNGQEWGLEKIENPLPESENNFSYWQESAEAVPRHIVRFLETSAQNHEETLYKVPPGKYFFMGDNRDQSSDGRVWGFVDESLLVGPAWMIWLSCEQTLEAAPFLCDPQKIRWKRWLKAVQ